MKGTVDAFTVQETTVSVYCPPNMEKAKLPAVYLNQSHAGDWDGWLPVLERSMMKGQCKRAYLVTVEPTDWGRDFSPWAAEGLHSGDTPFAGQADARVELLVRTVKPEIDRRYPTLPERENTGIFGYSLGGLAALYALYRTDAFGMVGALSASLWFPGFMEYQRTHAPAVPARVYLSLGSKEEKTRHPLLCSIGDCYRETVALLQGRCGEENVHLDLHPGGHGTEVDRRILTGLLWLLKV